MPDVALPYTPGDGATLDPDGINKDLYETPANLPANQYSLYETSNGQIDPASNFVAGFKVQSHQVQPWQVGHAVATGAVEPLDFFQDAWGKDQVFYGIAGARMTWYQPYDVSMSLLVASAFISTWRQRGKSTGQGTWDSHNIVVQSFFDGHQLDHMNRRLPETAYYPSTATYGFDFTREQNLTRHFNLVHPKFTGGSAGKYEDILTRGWHTFGFTIYMEANKGEERINPNADGTGIVEPLPPIKFDAMHRARVYVRNCCVIRLL